MLYETGANRCMKKLYDRFEKTSISSQARNLLTNSVRARNIISLKLFTFSVISKFSLWKIYQYYLSQSRFAFLALSCYFYSILKALVMKNIIYQLNLSKIMVSLCIIGYLVYKIQILLRAIIFQAMV